MAKKKQAKKKHKCGEKIKRYWPMYITVNGKPVLPTRRAVHEALDWAHEYKYTPYVTINYGTPPGCVPGKCQ